MSRERVGTGLMVDPVGVAYYRIEFDQHRQMCLVMTIPCPLKHERERVGQLVRELNAVRLGKED